MLTENQMPALRPIPVTKRGERRRYKLLEDWKCELLGRGFTFIIPKGFVFDGASIPRLFWNMLSPSGYLFIAGLLHDFLYKYRFVYIYSSVILNMGICGGMISMVQSKGIGPEV